MRREIAVLNLGHEATLQFHAALKKDPYATNLHQLITLNTGLKDAQNTYLCASFLAGHTTAKDDARKVANRMTVTVFNRMAVNTWQVLEQIRKVAENDEGHQQNSPVNAAEAISSLVEEHKDAASDLVDVTTISAMMTLNNDDPNSKVVDRLLITCKERQTLLLNLLPLTRATAPDDFTKDAEVLQSFLKKPYKCG